jgi:DNA-binding PadR family transcriptional regulator
MPRSPRRTETPIATTVAALQGLRWGPASAQVLLVAIAERTGGYEQIGVGLIYKALDQLVAAGLVKKTRPVAAAAAIYALTATGRRQAKATAGAIGRLFAE